MSEYGKVQVMRKEDWYTMEVCQDCLYVGANGAPDYEGYATSGHPERYEQALKTCDSEPISTDDTEGHFSWQSCDFCGDSLGGTRYTASVLFLKKETTQ
jgi:hypothetical protein